MRRKQGSDMQDQAYLDINDAIDITRPLDPDTPVFPGDPKVCIEKMVTEDIKITKITLCSHSGTHLDAPSHYITEGDDITDIPLQLINGRVRVVNLFGINREIQPDDLKVGEDERILIKTGYSSINHFEPAYSALSSECAEYIVNSGIRCIGTDAPSIESFEGDGSVHRTLLSAKVAIIELLDLSLTEEGIYIMNALPLPLADCDGAPVRALLFRINEEKQ